MAVCQYFLKGTCKFGNQCRNQHPSGGVNQRLSFTGLNKSSLQFQGGGQSKNNPFGNNRPSNNGNNQDSVEKIISSIKFEMHSWEVSGMWPFSCFSFQKDKPCLTGLTDYSPEEIRLEAYKAKTSNNTNQYLSFLQQCSEQSKKRRTELKCLDVSTWAKEERQLTGGSAPQTTGLFQNRSQGSSLFTGSSSLFSNTQNQPKSSGLFSSSSSGSSIFGQTGQSIFQQPSSLGSQASNTNFASQNPFGKPASTSLFGQSTSNQGLQSQNSKSMDQNNFTQQTNQQTNQGLFSQHRSSTGLFSQQTSSTAAQQQQQGLFSQQKQGLFGSVPITQNNGNGQQVGLIGQKAISSLFGGQGMTSNITQSSSSPALSITQNANPFLQAAMQQKALISEPSQVAPQVLSTLKMTDKDLAAFQADSFVYGQIPECPPPPELC